METPGTLSSQRKEVNLPEMAQSRHCQAASHFVVSDWNHHHHLKGLTCTDYTKSF